jgi:hypothetical protein
MTQQPILTADEVYELIKTMPLSEKERKALKKKIAPHIQLAGFTPLENPRKEIPMLEKCANFLRDKGIYVFFWADPRGFCFFIAGEVGRIYERLLRQTQRLGKIHLFLLDYGWCLKCDTTEIVRAVRFYISEVASEMLSKIGVAYELGLKEQLPDLCAKGWEVIARIDDFLRKPIIAAAEMLLLGLEDYQLQQRRGDR